MTTTKNASHKPISSANVSRMIRTNRNGFLHSPTARTRRSSLRSILRLKHRRSTTTDAVVFDAMMPEMNGAEWVRVMRSDKPQMAPAPNAP